MQNQTFPLPAVPRLVSIERTTRSYRVLFFIGLSLVFSIAYTQSPLFTSNQNQYFLHGLARAGWGNLRLDWLANTFDPTPVFSWLVEVTYRIFRQVEIFYLYYALLMGVYLYSLLGIISLIYDIATSRARSLVYLSLLVAFHSAALRFALSRVFGHNLAYVFEDGFADQRLLGPVFQPSTFGVLLVLAIYLHLSGRPYWAALSAALAAVVHPTYLLSAATLVLAFVLDSLTRLGQWSVLATRSAVRKAFRGPVVDSHRHRPAIWKRVARAAGPGFLALAVVAPIVVYVFFNLGNTPEETTTLARRILVHQRIPHHALVSWWFDISAVIKIALISAALYLIRHQRLLLILLVPTLVGAGLTVLQALTGNDALALIFPWRISTWIVPLCTAIVLAWLVSSVFDDFSLWVDRYQRPLIRAALALIAAVVAIGGIRLALDFARKAASPERPLYAHVSTMRKPGQTYLIPVKMQDFRLETGAPAYVDFKSIPYRDSDVLEWQRRHDLADQFYLTNSCQLLPQFAGEGITHVVLPATAPAASCPGLAEIYRDANYSVHKLSELQ